MQTQIAKHLLGPHTTRLHLVHGGLGSGKTHLFRDLAIGFAKQNKQVVLLASSGKAQRALQQSFAKHAATAPNRIRVESIESCANLLLQHSDITPQTNLNSIRLVRDRSDLQAMFSSKLFDLPLPSAYRPLLDPTSQVGKILEYFNWLKKSNISPEQFAAQEYDLAKCYLQWNRALRAENVYEADDLLAMANNTLQSTTEEAVRRIWGDSVLLVDDFHLYLPNQVGMITLLANKLNECVLFADFKQEDAYRPTASINTDLHGFHKFDELPVLVQPVKFVPLQQQKGEELAALEEWVLCEQQKPNNVAVLCTRSGMDRDALFTKLLQARLNVQLLGARDYWLDSVEIRSLMAFANLILRGHLTADRDLFTVWTSDFFSAYKATPKQIQLFGELKSSNNGGDKKPSTMLDIITSLGENGKRLQRDLAALEQFASEGNSLSLICLEVLKQSGVLVQLDAKFNASVAGRIAQFCQLVQRIEFRNSASVQTSSLEVLDYLDLYMNAGGGDTENEDDGDGRAASENSGSVVFVATMHTVCSSFTSQTVDSLCLARCTDQKLPIRRKPMGLPLPWDFINNMEGPELDSAYFETPKDMDKRLLLAVCNRTKSNHVVYSHESGETPSALVSPSTQVNAKPKTTRRKRNSTADEEENVDGNKLLLLANSNSPQVNLSFSTLSVYESCPKKYWYSKVIGLVVPSNLRMVNGKALHYGIEAHYNARLANSNSMDNDELLQIAMNEYSLGFDRAILANPEGFVSREHLLQVKASGMETIKAFHARFLNNLKVPSTRILVQAEQRFEFDWKEAGITITGFIDLVERNTSSGGLVLTDFKSNVLERSKLNRLGRSNDQLAMYAWFCEREWGETPELVGIESIETGERYEEPPPKSFDSVKEKLLIAAQGIRSKQFDAKPTYMDCTFCAFNKICSSSVV